jgi:YfiH family protein
MLTENPEARLSPALAATGIRHGFFGRRGGVSTGLYGSLNCGFGSGDTPGDVARNRGICAESLGLAPESLVTVHQVHGIEIAEATEPWRREDAPRADAIVTSRPGIALGILTADCAPILLRDAAAGVIGAAHAGWKGARAGIAEAVVAAMLRLGAKPGGITACVGPAIGAESYEVGADFRAAFVAEIPMASGFFIDRPGSRPCFDLQGFVAARLSRLGLAVVDRVAADTCAEPEDFFSYRRSCHLGEHDYGRQISLIARVAGP